MKNIIFYLKVFFHDSAIDDSGDFTKIKKMILIK